MKKLIEKLVVKNVQMIDHSEWNRFVSEVYDRPYNLQQQDGCQGRDLISLTVPSEDEDAEMNDEIPEEVNDEIMGVKFEKWLQRDPTVPVNGKTDYTLGLWWDRNFYPDLQTVANDLQSKGLLEAGNYVININL